MVSTEKLKQVEKRQPIFKKYIIRNLQREIPIFVQSKFFFERLPANNAPKNQDKQVGGCGPQYFE